MDFAGLDTEQMEMKSLLDDNFRRFSKILPTRTFYRVSWRCSNTKDLVHWDFRERKKERGGCDGCIKL